MQIKTGFLPYPSSTNEKLGQWMQRAIAGPIGLVLVLLFFGQPCLAEGLSTEFNRNMFSDARSEQTDIQQQGPDDPQELKAFLDNFFAQQMTQLHIPGAAIAIVKDGKPFFTAGYGYADLEKKIPVDPNQTLFRLASVSKLFAATAVMQLAERGQLKLKDDVNKYLKNFQLQENYPAPVTIESLLTHTGGFDEKFIGLAARNASELIPLGEYLAKRMPPRVIPPGQIISYSNHGIALAGYLVEEISGIPFAQYTDENILQPLDMQQSSFLQPLPARLASDLAVGYEYRRGNYQPVPSYYINDGPAGALKATATDISHFIIAHLQKGRYGNTKIIEETTAQQMHASHFTHHPQLPGWAYGFSERFQNNLRAIEHGGTDPGFASLLFLLPEQKLGLFVAYNNEQDELREQLVSQFLDRYYPVKEPISSPQPNPNFQHRANYFVGNYRFSRYPHSTIEKLAPVLLKAPVSAPELRVRAKGDGILTVEPSSYRPNRSPRRALKKVDSVLYGAVTDNSNTSSRTRNQLVEIEPLLFQFTDGPYVAFKENSRGRITHMFIGADAFEKLAWYETNAFQLSLFGFCILAFLSSCIGWSSRSLTHRWQKDSSRWGSKQDIQSLVRLSGSTLPVAISALNLFFLFGTILAILLSNLYEFAYGLPPIITTLLCIPIMTTSLTAVLPVFMVLSWQDKRWSVLGRLYYLFFILCAWGFISFLSYWNLLGFEF
ncbi:serine hydrolase [Chroococcidiopsis sp. CCALA 051]|uniref:serine hydrolase domain-containing protein n=1 Tax=Chroococcidiopsis sp. CCALA 051 TaxID=869949 RepID=UPI001E2C67D9|nr:serine hydrolase domain-containing protein [Chroococcidiopsis sp. CCALA 051]